MPALQNQLKDIAGKSGDWERLNTVVLAISPNKPADNAAALKSMKLAGVRVLSDSDFRNAKRFRAYDDFEEMEVHSTILIDGAGAVHWAHAGGAPFSDTAFLVKQVERMAKESRE